MEKNLIQKTDALQPLLLCLLFASISILSFFKIADYDIFYQLKSGQMMVQEKTIPFTEDFAFTPPAGRFVNQEWLSEIFFYALDHLGGYDALSAFKIVLVVCLFGLLYRRLRDRGVDVH